MRRTCSVSGSSSPNRLLHRDAFEQVTHGTFGCRERVVEVVVVDDGFERRARDGIGEQASVEPLLDQRRIVYRVQQQIDFPPVDATRTCGARAADDGAAPVAARRSATAGRSARHRIAQSIGVDVEPGRRPA